MASRDELKRLIDALPEAETDHALVLLGALIQPGSHRPSPDEASERRGWLDAGLEVAVRRLAAVESDVPPEQRDTWLAQWAAVGTPIRWDQARGEFVEVDG